MITILKNSAIWLSCLRSDYEVNKNNLVWMKQMVNASGDEWKDTRQAVSPIFTSGKLKTMMILIDDVIEELVKSVGDKSDQDEMFELKDMLGRFSMDTIASCAFGVDSESFSNPNSKFAEHARNIFTRSKKETLLAVASLIPGMMKVFNFFEVSLFKPTETQFFVRVVEDALR